MIHVSTTAAVLVGLSILAGCATSPESTRPAPAPAAAAPAPAAPASTPAAATAPAAGTVAYQEDKTLGGRGWAAAGLDLKAYDAVYLTPVAANVATLNPDGVQNLEWAKGVLRDEVASSLRASNLFAAVVTSEAEIRPGTRVLRFEHTIVEYEKGGGGARFFAGLYGAGQPVLKVQGRLTGGGAGQPLFLYEARRSGDSGESRLFGGYRSDRDIQLEDIKDLARDLADYMARTLKK
jgi:hypothetical protein